jgi:hypothetical protein
MIRQALPASKDITFTYCGSGGERIYKEAWNPVRRPIKSLTIWVESGAEGLFLDRLLRIGSCPGIALAWVKQASLHISRRRLAYATYLRNEST